jgi:membrane-bound metal-dependent hydrolase YbcI (DUF457 family)
MRSPIYPPRPPSACLSWRASSRPRRFYVAALIASVAIDADHIPLYLGLLGNQAQRPVTHSLSTVAVFAAAAAASRRHRAVLGGVTAGLVLHFARDIAEGYPGVRVFWPLQDNSWMVSYWWFLGMIAAFTAARLVLVSTGLPRTASPSSGRRPGLAHFPAPRTARRHRVTAARGPGPPGPDLDAAREARPRTSLRSPPGCRDAADTAVHPGRWPQAPSRHDGRSRSGIRHGGVTPVTQVSIVAAEL